MADDDLIAGLSKLTQNLDLLILSNVLLVGSLNALFLSGLHHTLVGELIESLVGHQTGQNHGHAAGHIVGAVVVLLGVIVLLAAGHQAQSHDQRKKQCQKLFHVCFPPLNLCEVYGFVHIAISSCTMTTLYRLISTITRYRVTKYLKKFLRFTQKLCLAIIICTVSNQYM